MPQKIERNRTPTTTMKKRSLKLPITNLADVRMLESHITTSRKKLSDRQGFTVEWREIVWSDNGLYRKLVETLT